MLEGKGCAMASASQALDLYKVFDYTSIAAFVKKDFDKMYGSGRQCVVGTNFSCFLTHCKGTLIYLALKSLNFLVFKAAAAAAAAACSSSSSSS